MKTVLTVDDSKVVRSMVTRHLQSYGCAIIEACNGQEGVEMARTHKPDLVLLDVTMPVMDGKQALAELRKDPTTKEIPVVMLTAESGKDLVVEIVELGVNGYIVKPFQQEVFEKEVSKHLGAPGGQAAAADVAAPLDARTVLIVDDSEKVLAMAKAALEQSMPDEMLQEYLSEEGDCPVFSLPNPSPKLLARLLPVFGKKLRALAEDGNDKLILDAAKLNDLTSEHVTMVVRLLSEAGTLGVRTAICAPEQIVAKLRQIAETSEAPCAATRDAARQCLQ